MTIVLTDDQAKDYISKNVNRLLEKMEMSPADLARATGENRVRISSVTRGLHNPSASFLARLAEALGVTPNDLLAKPARIERSKAS